ncbi:right-handed parallel beta-helix repeat-containing protein [Porphyrobacter sp. AAP60]|uniref:right-handed parallel beta-helix repeat-containing protein n=1 Tax=Porphyrobacter sp. AAP60 TaxID=1523423 RepID=UPI0006B9FD83|nr:right-handed parallel beta-helix repeat-containing protein [Porphyrobacter sp. AAP60]
MENIPYAARGVIRPMLACLMLLSPFPATAADDQSLTLASFGAVGDDRADDTQALQKAFRQASGRCLDGEGRTYRVRGTLRGAADFCLANARLRQDVAAFDTRPWMRGDCPVEKDAQALADCGDPAMPDPVPAGLDAYLYTRTLLIRPERGEPPIKVSLRNVTVDRGASPESGARSDAAGIWIGNARDLVLEDVEVTGAGKGYGVIIVDSADITIRRLWLHDMVWAPYLGDAPLLLDRARHIGWNSVPLREFRRAGDRGARQNGFYGTRSQEQLTCLSIEGSSNVLIDDLRIDGCRARFVEGDIPWQTDGMGVGQSSSNIQIENARISDTWEGIDMGNVDNIALSNAEITDSFNYAVKVGYQTHAVSLVDSVFSRAGIAGVVISGPVRDTLIRRVRIDEPGRIFFAGAMQSPWGQGRAGVELDMGNPAQHAKAYPTGVLLENVTVRGGRDCPLGLLNRTPERVSLEGLRVSGCEAVSQHAPR